MEREIKFRAWDKINKSFARRSAFISDGGGFYVDSDPYGVDMSGQRKISMRPNQYEFGGEFTGLKDKNGIEIYSKDIVKAFIDLGPAGEEERIFEVKVSPFGVNIEEWNYREGKLPEIIGNIYENPELIN